MAPGSQLYKTTLPSRCLNAICPSSSLRLDETHIPYNTITMSKLPITAIGLGAALYVLRDAPPSIRDPALERLRSFLSAEQITSLVGFLRSAFVTTAALDAVYYVNSALNSWALNNWQSADTSRWNWSQEVAVVTGGASGLGKGFTERLVSHGVHVVVLDVTPAPAEFKGNSKITHFTCDVTNAEEVKAVGKKIKSTLGHPSILINNAGIGQPVTVADITPKQLQAIMGVNLMAHWYMTQEFLPHMIEEKKGHIITIASMASFVAPPGIAHYAATKAGVMAYHEAMSSELRSIHDCPEVHTTIVHPSWVSTPMVQPHAHQLKAARQPIMEPKVVIDAVVGQILSCKGGKLVLGRGSSIVKRLRFYPNWMSALMVRPLEKARKNVGDL